MTVEQLIVDCVLPDIVAYYGTDPGPTADEVRAYLAGHQMMRIWKDRLTKLIVTAVFLKYFGHEVDFGQIINEHIGDLDKLETVHSHEADVR